MLKDVGGRHPSKESAVATMGTIAFSLIKKWPACLSENWPGNFLSVSRLPRYPFSPWDSHENHFFNGVAI
jgi:hypothetical protein